MAKRRTRDEPIDERSWSARRSVHPRDASAELVHYSPLPAETGPVWAPDRLSVWPLEGARYGIDAHYAGATGTARAEHQAQRLARVGIRASVQPEDGGSMVRLGPLTHGAVWLALESFLGRSLE